MLILLSAATTVCAQDKLKLKEKISIGRPILEKAGDTVSLTADTAMETDVSDLYNLVFHQRKVKAVKAKKASSVVLLPTLGYTPSTGFEFGADVSGSGYFGNPANTTLSVFDAFAAISTNELALIQLNHNIYTKANKWNIQGSWNLGKTVILDHGTGTGNQSKQADEIRYSYRKLTESVYRNIFPNFYAGAGLAFNYYTKITQEILPGDEGKVLNEKYSLSNGYPSGNYYANGLLLELQYNTRDQPYRPYKGIYIDLIVRSNRKWLGSEKSAIQLKTELRKYWGLSQKNPEQVLAYWFWATYLLHGSVPYLELPGTGSDNQQRLGRGYTIGRFKGPSFVYNEMEYRFPITRNKLLSGVAFINLQTASDQLRTKLFRYLEPGAGGGLRILFNKQTRSNLCLDYGIGNYGSHGVFVGLNEVF